MKQYQNKLEVFCETLKNPIGIDNPNPRFSWHPHNSGVTAAQKSYRVVVYEAKGYQCVWDSGNVEQSDSVAVRYAGEKLESFGEYSVEVEEIGRAHV